MRSRFVRFVSVAVVVAAGVLVPVAVSAQSEPSTQHSDVTVVIAAAGSLSDVGTAASLVAGGAGDAVLLAETADAVGDVASQVLGRVRPARVLLVGGAAALSERIEAEIGDLVSGVSIERLEGRDRLHTAVLAARRVADDGSVASVVIANGWSLADVGTAASAVASGAADVVLYADAGALGDATEAALGGLAPARVLLVGGTAALSAETEAEIGSVLPDARVERRGGDTRIDTAALFAAPALAAGADHAVIANGWSLGDVGVAAAYAAADPDAAVLYGERDALSEPTAAALRRYRPPTVTLVGDVGSLSGAVEREADRRLPDAQVRRFFERSDADAAARAAFSVLTGDSPVAPVPAPNSTAVPPDAADLEFAAVEAGSLHTCGLRTDRTVVCWGRNSDGEATAPSGRFTAVTAGGSHSCAIATDDSVVCWGFDEDGQTTAPPGAFSALAAGRTHTCAIRTDDSVVCWGGSDHGQR